MSPSWGLLAALVAASAGAERGDDRPLGVGTPGTWRALFLELPLEDARPGPRPLITVGWWAANSWSIPTRLTSGGRVVEVQQDEQADAVELGLHLDWARLLGEGALSRRLTSELSFRVLSHGGGWSDGLVEAWHHALKLNDFDRPRYPAGAVALTLREPGGPTAFALAGPRTAVGDLALRTQLRLAEGRGPGGPWALAARLALKLPTGSLAEATGSGGTDAGVALGLSAAWCAWLTVHAQLGAVLRSPFPVPLALQPEPWQVGLELGLVARLPAGWAVLVETRAHSPVVSPAWTLAGGRPRQGDAVTALTFWQNQLTVGLRQGPFTIWLAEDFTPGARPEVGWRWFYDSDAPDLAVGATLALP